MEGLGRMSITWDLIKRNKRKRVMNGGKKRKEGSTLKNKEKKKIAWMN